MTEPRRNYCTIQFATGGLFDGVPDEPAIHLVSMDRCVVTLCGIDRSNRGFAINGGITSPAYRPHACEACEAAREPGRGVASSVFGHLFQPLASDRTEPTDG